MKKKTIIIIAACVLLVLAILGGTALGRRLAKRHTDIIGVTTLIERNLVIMNSASGTEFVSGSGTITVGEGERLHVEYALKEGSYDLAFHLGDDGLDVFHNTDLTALPAEGEVFGRSGVEGSGSFDLEVPAGVYTVFFDMHKAVGSTTISAK